MQIGRTHIIYTSWYCRYQVAAQNFHDYTWWIVYKLNECNLVPRHEAMVFREDGGSTKAPLLNLQLICIYDLD